MPATAVNTAKTRRGVTATLTHVSKLQRAVARGSIHYDMSKVQHWDPCMTLLLMRLANSAQHSITVTLPMRDACMRWLDDVGLFGDERGSPTKKTLRLRHLRSETELYDEIEQLLEFLTTSDALDALSALKFSSLLSEVLMNTFQHSGQGGTLKGALICGQSYRRAQHSMVAAVDWGDTIPGTMSGAAHYKELTMSDSEWIRFATKRATTARSTPENRGLGLASICEMVDKSGGTIHIVSRRGFFTRANGRETVADLSDRHEELDGTLVVVDLKPLDE